MGGNPRKSQSFFLDDGEGGRRVESTSGCPSKRGRRYEGIHSGINPGEQGTGSEWYLQNFKRALDLLSNPKLAARMVKAHFVATFAV
jgi:hypothetical protein